MKNLVAATLFLGTTLMAADSPEGNYLDMRMIGDNCFCFVDVDITHNNVGVGGPAQISCESFKTFLREASRYEDDVRMSATVDSRCCDVISCQDSRAHLGDNLSPSQASQRFKTYEKNRQQQSARPFRLFWGNLAAKRS